MFGIGFGLERIGIAAARFPILFSLIVIAVTVFAALNVPKVRFDGNITAVLPEESEAYRNYFAQADRFRDFSRDVTILIQSDRLFTAQGLEDLRALQLEIAINPAVGNVVSMFSAPDPDPLTGEIGQFFPPVIETDEDARQLVDELLEAYPQMRALAVPDKNTAAFVVAMREDADDPEAIGVDEEKYDGFESIRADAEAAAPSDFTLHYTGLTPIGITVVSSLVSDQWRLTIIGLILGAGIGLIVFRSVLAAIICAVPPTLTAVWALGLLGYLQMPINYLTTVLPTLALILAFADGIVLYFRWQTSNGQTDDPQANLVEALRRVGPASALTSITTLLAFFSFSFASGSALKEFSVLGMIFVAIAFLAVIITMPLACHWAARMGVVRFGKVPKPAYRTLGRRFFRFVVPRPLAIAIAAIVVAAALTYVHFQVRPEYRITDYLPGASDTREAERLANELIGGRSMLSVAVPVAVEGNPADPANLDRLRQVETAIRNHFPDEAIISILRFADKVTTEAGLERLAEQVGTTPGQTRRNFLSRDEKDLLVTLRVPSSQAITDTLNQITQLRTSLDELDYGDRIVVSGFDVLMAQEFTRLINQLRTSLLIAIFLGVVIIGIATRSPLLTLAAITPNLLPILGIEFVLWLRGGTINISEVIALTIAFGIAIDNAVHVINIFNAGLRQGYSRRHALKEALLEVGPALGASTTIICVSSLVTQISALPMVPILGQLMTATLIVALVANLAILPANIICLNALVKRFGWRR